MVLAELAKKIGCAEIAEGNVGCVWICSKQIKTLRKADESMQKRAIGLMKRYADYGTDSFNSTQFKLVTTDKSGGSQLKLFEFKANQLRLYGIQIILDGLRVFIVTRVDPKKKENKATQRILEAAIDTGWDMKERIGAHYGKG